MKWVLLAVITFPFSAQATELSPWEQPRSLYESLNREYTGIGNMGRYEVPEVRDRFITTHPNGGGIRIPQEDPPDYLKLRDRYHVR